MSTTEPSNTAITMKNEQTVLQDNQIKLLFLKRKELNQQLQQVAIDLKHVGYNPPDQCSGPKTYTLHEAITYLESTGDAIINATDLNQLRTSNIALKHEVGRLNYKIENQAKHIKKLKGKKPTKKK